MERTPEPQRRGSGIRYRGSDYFRRPSSRARTHNPAQSQAIGGGAWLCPRGTFHLVMVRLATFAGLPPQDYREGDKRYDAQAP